MPRSFWHAAAALSIYTSIIVYCKQHRLLDGIMEGIKYNNYHLPTQSRHKLYGRCNRSLLFLSRTIFSHTSTLLMWSNFRVSEQASGSRFTFLPSRTLGHNTLLLMIVARIKLVTSQLETCTDGNFGSWLAAAPGPSSDAPAVCALKWLWGRMFSAFIPPCYEFEEVKIHNTVNSTIKRESLSVHRKFKLCSTFSAQTEASGKSPQSSRDCAGKILSWSIIMAAGWSDHEGYVGLLISKQICEGALESRRRRKRETYSFLPQASVGLLLSRRFERRSI